MKTLFCVGVFLILFSNHSSCQNNDIETLKKLNRDFLNSIVNRDTATLSNILADDFMLINPGGIKRNKADNLSSALVLNQKISVDIDSVEVRMLSGEVGLVTAWTNNVIITEKDKSSFKICYQDVYMKRRNKWVAVAAHVSLLGTH
jgi:ketosteroid isomerase-like protein